MLDFISNNSNLIIISLLTVVVSVIISILCTLALRRRLTGERLLKNIKEGLANFRSDVTSTSERMKNEAQSCEAKVRARCDEGTRLVREISETFEMLRVHSSELAKLDGVCVEYGNALEKLKNETEQAEGRISVVFEQAEKIEAMGRFLKQSEEDFAVLRTQLENAKREYVDLVNATEEEMRGAAERQLEVNKDLLSSFYGDFDKKKNEFGQYLMAEKVNFEEFTNNQRASIQEDARILDSQKEIIFNQVEGAKGWIGTEREEIKKDIELLESRSDDLKDDAMRTLQNVKTSLLEELGKFEQAEQIIKSDIQTVLGEIEGEKNKAFEDIKLSAQERKKEIDRALEEASGVIKVEADKAREAIKLNILESEDASARLRESVKEVSDEVVKQIDDGVARLSSEKEKIAADTSRVIGEVIDKTASDASLKLDELRSAAEKIIESLDGKINQTRETISQLSEGEKERIASSVERLNDLKENIEKNEKEIALLLEEKEKTEEEIKRGEKEKEDLLLKLESEKKAFEGTIENLTKEKEDLENTLTLLRREVEEIKEERARAEKEVKEIKDRIEEFPEEIIIEDV